MATHLPPPTTVSVGSATGQAVASSIISTTDERPFPHFRYGQQVLRSREYFSRGFPTSLPLEITEEILQWTLEDRERAGWQEILSCPWDSIRLWMAQWWIPRSRISECSGGAVHMNDYEMRIEYMNYTHGAIYEQTLLEQILLHAKHLTIVIITDKYYLRHPVEPLGLKCLPANILILVSMLRRCTRKDRFLEFKIYIGKFSASEPKLCQVEAEEMAKAIMRPFSILRGIESSCAIRVRFSGPRGFKGLLESPSWQMWSSTLVRRMMNNLEPHHDFPSFHKRFLIIHLAAIGTEGFHAESEYSELKKKNTEIFIHALARRRERYPILFLLRDEAIKEFFKHKPSIWKEDLEVLQNAIHL